MHAGPLSAALEVQSLGSALVPVVRLRGFAGALNASGDAQGGTQGDTRRARPADSGPADSGLADPGPADAFAAGQTRPGSYPAEASRTGSVPPNPRTPGSILAGPDPARSILAGPNPARSILAGPDAAKSILAGPGGSFPTGRTAQTGGGSAISASIADAIIADSVFVSLQLDDAPRIGLNCGRDIPAAGDGVYLCMPDPGAAPALAAALPIARSATVRIEAALPGLGALPPVEQGFDLFGTAPALLRLHRAGATGDIPPTEPGLDLRGLIDKLFHRSAAPL